ncbi:MAG: hypothetical protein D6694_15685 [Gammaproteobacteria bacterium]|nr:MAG: hypothetical protein D6694_15685 [Gammaproteobacteria bacterium]
MQHHAIGPLRSAPRDAPDAGGRLSPGTAFAGLTGAPIGGGEAYGRGDELDLPPAPPALAGR